MTDDSLLIIQYLQENGKTNEEVLDILKKSQRIIEQEIVQEQLNTPCTQIKIFEI